MLKKVSRRSRTSAKRTGSGSSRTPTPACSRRQTSPGSGRWSSSIRRAVPLNAAQEAAFEAYFRAGGGFVGVGSAIETEPDWQFLTEILGTRSTAKLGAQTVTNKVADQGHDASKNLPEYWNLNDTYYNWASNVRGLSHVLTTVSGAPFNRTGDGPTINALTGGTMGADHPVTWCKDYKGGRSYYTNHGASSAAWNDANLAKELLGAIKWAAGDADPIYSDCGATVRANYQQSFVAAPPNLQRADRLRRACLTAQAA